MRLDQYLVAKGYFESRNKASSSVKEGNFTVDGRQIFKPSFDVSESSVVEGTPPKNYVARSAHKLLQAFSVFSLQWSNKVAVDLGASTGGFCQVLLENNLKKVYAVDIGTAQLHPSIKEDRRIVNMEHTNARNVNSLNFHDPVDVITADLSFISIKLILPAIYNTLRPNGEAIVLIKPQFEAGPSSLTKSGVVTDRKVHLRIIIDVADFSEKLGFGVCGLAFSGLSGESGNREYLLYLKKDTETSINLASAAQYAVKTEENHA